uniref:Uncharacterized protein n=1 Tax=Arundo donax TaxID=35708 RepID=A0A0A9AN36_ARUDO
MVARLSPVITDDIPKSRLPTILPLHRFSFPLAIPLFTS